MRLLALLARLQIFQQEPCALGIYTNTRVPSPTWFLESIVTAAAASSQTSNRQTARKCRSPEVREGAKVVRDATREVAPAEVQPLHRAHAASAAQKRGDGPVDGVVVV